MCCQNVYFCFISDELKHPYGLLYKYPLKLFLKITRASSYSLSQFWEGLMNQKHWCFLNYWVPDLAKSVIVWETEKWWNPLGVLRNWGRWQRSDSAFLLLSQKGNLVTLRQNHTPQSTNFGHFMRYWHLVLKSSRTFLGSEMFTGL